MRNEALAVHFGSSLYVLANEIQTKQSDPDYSLKIRTILDKAIEKLSLSTIESELWDLLCTFLKNYEFNLALMCELKRVETPLHPVGYNLAKKLTEKYILNNENMLIIDSLTALYPNILDSPLGRSINFRRLLSKGMSVEDLLSSHGHDLSIEDGIKISKMTKT